MHQFQWVTGKPKCKAQVGETSTYGERFTIETNASYEINSPFTNAYNAISPVQSWFLPASWPQSMAPQPVMVRKQERRVSHSLLSSWSSPTIFLKNNVISIIQNIIVVPCSFALFCTILCTQFVHRERGRVGWAAPTMDET